MEEAHAISISEGVWALELTDAHGTIYPTLLKIGTKVALVDTGFPQEFDLLTKALSQAQTSPSHLTDIYLTHHDIDHIGCLKEILKANPKVQISAHSKEIPYLTGEKKPEKLEKLEREGKMLETAESGLNTEDGGTKGELDLERQAFFSQLELAFYNRRVHVDNELRNREVLQYGGGVEVLWTPGHTAGHTAFYVQKHKVLIAGDTLRVVDGKLELPDENLASDYELALESVRKLTSYDIETIICYHGGIYTADNIKIKLLRLLEIYEARLRGEERIVTNPDDGDDQVFGEGQFPPTLDKLNGGVMFWSFLGPLFVGAWGWAIAIGIVQFLIPMYVVKAIYQAFALQENFMVQAVVAIVLSIIGYSMCAVCGFTANRIAWRRRRRLIHRAENRGRQGAAEYNRYLQQTVGMFKSNQKILFWTGILVFLLFAARNSTLASQFGSESWIVFIYDSGIPLLIYAIAFIVNSLRIKKKSTDM